MHTDRLARENRRLRTAMIAVVAAVLGAAAMGLSDTPPSTRALTPVGIATDGDYVYVLFKDGRINRMEIEARERFNLCYPEYYHSNEPHKWNRFVEQW